MYARFWGIKTLSNLYLHVVFTIFTPDICYTKEWAIDSQAWAFAQENDTKNKQQLLINTFI